MAYIATYARQAGFNVGLLDAEAHGLGIDLTEHGADEAMRGRDEFNFSVGIPFSRTPLPVIRRHLATGHTVVCGRYLPSSLVLQRLDGVPLEFVRAINAGIDRPDLAVILTARADTIAGRLTARGSHHRRGGGAADRIGFFFEATEWDNEPVNREPEKCLGLRWFSVHGPPDDLIPYPAAGLLGYLDGRFGLTLHGWPGQVPGRTVFTSPSPRS